MATTSPSIKLIRASDGSGNASAATVQAIRAPLATTILVDTVQGLPDNFYGSMGTPHTFTDPVTGETITVISESTAVDFEGHVDGSNLEIDAIAAGYTDNGSAVGDIVIIRPTTPYANNVADVLDVSHNDDGTFKDNSINDADMFADPLDPVTRGLDLIFDHVASGCVWSGDAYASTRAASMTAGVVYINGKRITVAAVTARLFTASKDTYIDVLDAGDGTGTVVYTETTNNNYSSPALAANSVRIGIIVTGASNIADAGSVNQGQETKLLPLASASEYMQVTDTIGNLICPRDPGRNLLGARQVANADRATASTSYVDITGLKTTVKTPANRKIKLKFGARWAQGSSAGVGIYVRVTEDGNQLYEKILTTPGANYASNIDFEIEHTPATSGAHTYNFQYKTDAGTMTVKATGGTGAKAFCLVEQS